MAINESKFIRRSQSNTSVKSTGQRSTRSTGLRPLRVDVKNTKVTKALNKLSTTPNYKVTGNIVPYDIFKDNDVRINHILTDDVILAFASVGGIGYDDYIEYENEDELIDNFIMHTFIQSDPGDLIRWRDA